MTETIPTSPPKAKRAGRIAVRLPAHTADAAEPTQPKRGREKGRRGDEVRGRVLAAALDCFGIFGFEGTSTRAVAERAGVTHTLVLYHFQSKDNLWIATIESALQEYGVQVREYFAMAEELSARDALSKFIEQFVRMSADKPQIHRILTSQANHGSQRLEWLIDNFLRWHYTTICDLIRRGQSEGTVRQCDPARLYYLIIGTGGTPFTLAAEYRELTGRDVFSPAEILRNIAFIYEIVFT